MITVNNRCPSNHPCPVVGICPTGAIKQRGFAAPTVDNSKCIDCNICVKNCGYRAFVKS